MGAKYGIDFRKLTGGQFVDHVDRLKKDSIEFVLSPKLWGAHPGVKQALKWDRVPFSKTHKKKVPKKRGVYCFAIQPPIENGPPALFLLYIGETGNKGGGTLNGRFGQYFREQTKLKRAHLFYALNKWKKAIHFFFAVVANGDLKKVEAILNGAYVPPYSHEDFDAFLRKVVSAWRHS